MILTSNHILSLLGKKVSDPKYRAVVEHLKSQTKDKDNIHIYEEEADEDISQYSGTLSFKEFGIVIDIVGEWVICVSFVAKGEMGHMGYNGAIINDITMNSSREEIKNTMGTPIRTGDVYDYDLYQYDLETNLSFLYDEESKKLLLINFGCRKVFADQGHLTRVSAIYFSLLNPEYQW